MALKAAKEQVRALLNSVAEKDEEVYTSLDTAMGVCASKPVGPKVWCIIPVEDLPLACVLLKGPCYSADPNRICVVGVAYAGPVSQLPVLRAMEHGEILVTATELPATGVAKGKAMAALICAAGYAMPSVTLLATPAAVLADKDWDEFHYDPRFAFTPSAMTRRHPKGQGKSNKSKDFGARSRPPQLSAAAAAAGNGASSEGLSGGATATNVLTGDETGAVGGAVAAGPAPVPSAPPRPGGPGLQPPAGWPPVPRILQCDVPGCHAMRSTAPNKSRFCEEHRRVMNSLTRSVRQAAESERQEWEDFLAHDADGAAAAVGLAWRLDQMIAERRVPGGVRAPR